jgi:hypothetical protein
MEKYLLDDSLLMEPAVH